MLLSFGPWSLMFITCGFNMWRNLILMFYHGWLVEGILEDTNIVHPPLPPFSVELLFIGYFCIATATFCFCVVFFFSFCYTKSLCLYTLYNSFKKTVLL